MYRYSKWIHRQHLKEFDLAYDTSKARELIAEALKQGKKYLGEAEGNEILSAYGFPVLPACLASSPEEAAQAVEGMGPCVFKIASPDIIHKSDVGGVKMGISTSEEARKAWDEIVSSSETNMPDAEIQGIYVQKMAPKGVEVILGIKRYEIFGSLLMFGLGGIFVEIFNDVSFRLAPIVRNGARFMVRSIKAYPLLAGARGEPPTDMDELEKCLTRLSALAADNPEIAELDINPLIVHEKGMGCSVADCRILLEEEE
jgi:acetyltransferase